jgi:hypothetical protein
VTAELLIHLEGPVLAKAVRRELHKSNIHGRAADAKPTESNSQMRKLCVTTIKSTGYAWYGQMSRPSRCSLHQEEFTFGEHPRKPTIRNAWFGSNRETWGGPVMVWAAIAWYSNSVGPLINFHDRISAREYVDRFGNQVQPMIQTLLSRRQCPYSHSWKCSVVVWRAWKWTSTSSLASTITRFEHHWTTLISFRDYSEEQVHTSNISKATWRCSSRRTV